MKLTRRAATIGFDWENIEAVFAKIDEEAEELKLAISNDKASDISEEMGDLLFACVNLARKLDIDPEMALQSTNRKFLRRFDYIEKKLAAAGKHA